MGGVASGWGRGLSQGSSGLCRWVCARQRPLPPNCCCCCCFTRPPPPRGRPGISRLLRAPPMRNHADHQDVKSTPTPNLDSQPAPLTLCPSPTPPLAGPNAHLRAMPAGRPQRPPVRHAAGTSYSPGAGTSSRGLRSSLRATKQSSVLVTVAARHAKARPSRLRSHETALPSPRLSRATSLHALACPSQQFQAGQAVPYTASCAPRASWHFA